MLECHRLWIAPLSRIATSVSLSAAAAKISAGRAEITFARAAEILGGRAERTDAVLLMVEDRRVTTLLAPGEGEGGGRTSLLLVRMTSMRMLWRRRKC